MKQFLVGRKSEIALLIHFLTIVISTAIIKNIIILLSLFNNLKILSAFSYIFECFCNVELFFLLVYF